MAKNQELLRKAKVHVSVLKFLESKAWRVSPSVKEKYRSHELQIKVFEYCYDFLYHFIRNHESNSIVLTKKKYLKMFVHHLAEPALRNESLKILTELVMDNEVANKMLKDEDVSQLVFDSSLVSETLTTQLLGFFKVVIETDLGILKEREKLMIKKILKLVMDIL